MAEPLKLYLGLSTTLVAGIGAAFFLLVLPKIG
jgi:hypothetical protein